MSKHIALSRKIRRLICYIIIPLALCIGACGLFYLAGAPVLDLLDSNIRYVIVKGSPVYNYSKEYETDLVSNSTEVIEANKVTYPEVGTQYAILKGDIFDGAIPVYYGDDEQELENGAGQYAGSSLPGEGKTILIGAHDTTFFEPLENVKKGNKFTIKTSYGIFQYVVSKMEIHSINDQTAYNQEVDNEQLILYTCYPFGNLLGDRTKRYFVYCDKVGGPTIVGGQRND